MASFSFSSLAIPPMNSRTIHASALPKASSKPLVVRGDPPTFVSAPGRRIVAVADLHGDLAQARCALETAGVLSSDGQDLWSGGDTVLVQLGDILDRGEDEIAILSLLRSLDIQANREGGAVFQVNGNHETMNVEGDFRYVNPGGFDECADFLEHLDAHGHNWEEAFVSWISVSEQWKENRRASGNYWGPWQLLKRHKGVAARSTLLRPGGPLARELSRHGVALKVEDWLFCHGGLLPHHVAYGVDRLNTEVSCWMRGQLEEDIDDGQIPFLATRGYDSVVWNRLYSRDPVDKSLRKEQVCLIAEETLRALDAKAIVVGHTPQLRGAISKCCEKIWCIDVGMSSGVFNARPEVLEIVDNEVRILKSPADSLTELEAVDYI
ncbi:calcineurin-like metallo-phosphoesterase superfamily protein [Wolffia australiana]